MDQFEPLDVGDKVKHPKFGTGTVMQRFGENENQKVIVKFGAEYGEKKLVTKIANMKRISERPTLSATPAAPGSFPSAAPAPTVVPAKAPRAALEEELEEEGEDIALDEDAEDDVFDEDEGETGDEEAEEE